MNILSIGNSFSMDSQRWVREIAAADGFEIVLGDLYIGGCSLERHWENALSGAPAYDYSENNRSLGSTSLQTGLKDCEWDVITLQQASHFSGMEETYFPFIEELADYVRKTCPKAKVYVNQTWAYEYDSTHSQFVNYHNDRHEMHARLVAAYDKAAKAIGAPVIPVGKAVALARESAAFDPEKGGIALTRDGFHLSYQYGRFLAGAVWYEALTGNDVTKNAFIPCDQEYLGKDRLTDQPLYRLIADSRADETLIKKLRAVAHEAVQGA